MWILNTKILQSAVVLRAINERLMGAVVDFRFHQSEITFLNRWWTRFRNKHSPQQLSFSTKPSLVSISTYEQQQKFSGASSNAAKFHCNPGHNISKPPTLNNNPLPKNKIIHQSQAFKFKEPQEPFKNQKKLSKAPATTCKWFWSSAKIIPDEIRDT